MSANSKIEWTDHTFNPWRGCTKVAPECTNCYAETLSKRNPGTLGTWGPNGTRVVAAEQSWRDVLAWNRKAAAGECPACNGGRKVRTHESGYGYEHCETCDGSRVIAPYRQRVFCASLADVFEEWRRHVVDTQGNVMWHRNDKGIVSSGGTTINCSQGERTATLDDVRRRLFALIDATPNLDWLLLTKRPENIRRMWPAVAVQSQQQSDDRNERGELFRRNVWIGTSAGTQETAERSIPTLLECRDLSPVLFVSCEPMLGDVDFQDWMHDSNCAFREACCTCSDPREPRIDWVICGGESGPGARPMHPDWARSVRDQCAAAGVPFLFKQWGEWLPVNQQTSEFSDRLYRSNRVAKLHESQGAIDEMYGRTCSVQQCVIQADGTAVDILAPMAFQQGKVSMQTFRVGKKAAGRQLDGRTHNEFPEKVTA